MSYFSLGNTLGEILEYSEYQNVGSTNLAKKDKIAVSTFPGNIFHDLHDNPSPTRNYVTDHVSITRKGNTFSFVCCSVHEVPRMECSPPPRPLKEELLLKYVCALG